MFHTWNLNTFFKRTHNVDRCLSQTSIFLLKLFHSYPVCVELNLEDFVLLLQDIDAFLKLIARDKWSWDWRWGSSHWMVQGTIFRFRLGAGWIIHNGNNCFKIWNDIRCSSMKKCWLRTNLMCWFFSSNWYIKFSSMMMMNFLDENFKISPSCFYSFKC